MQQTTNRDLTPRAELKCSTWTHGIQVKLQSRLLRAITAYCYSHGPEKIEEGIWGDFCNGKVQERRKT